MRTSGNGTAWPQFVYLFISFPVPALCKIGISNKVSRRAGEVSEKVMGWAIPVFFVWIPFGWHVEQSMHRVFNFANVKFGNGKEWFAIPVAPFAIAVMLFWQLFWFSVVGLFALTIVWIISGCPDAPINSLVRLLGRLFQSLS